MTRTAHNTVSVIMTSVGGPHISVRLNRSVVLRHQCIRHVNSILCQPPNSETSPFIVGQNKAADVVLDKQVQAWHKDKSMVLERLNRYQNVTYDAFLRIELEKKTLRRYSDGFTVCKTAIDVKESGQWKRAPSGGKHDQAAAAAAAAAAESEDSLALGGQAKIQKRSRRLQLHASSAHVQSRRLASGHGRVRAPHDEQTRPVRLQSDNTTSLDVDFPDITNNRSRSHTGVPSRSSVVKLPSAVDASTSNADRRTDRSAKLRRNCTKLFRSNTTVATNCRTSDSAADGRPTTSGELDEKRDPWPTIATKSLTEMTFTTYRKDATGRIVQSDVPYTRREFPKPKEDNSHLHDRLLQHEETKKLQQQNRFEDLNRKLKQLDKWNPLDLIRSLRPQVYEGRSYGRVAIGSMDTLNRAYQNAADHHIRGGLEPGSAEGQRMSQYLRNKRATISTR